MKSLTARQQQVLDLIKNKIESTGMPPTRAEIATALGFRSANAAEEHLKALARKEVIQIVPGTSRGIRLLADYQNPVEEGLPLIGHVAAGEPILAEQHIETYYNVDATMFNPPCGFFAARKWHEHEKHWYFRW